jgi:hypothetical protein
MAAVVIWPGSAHSLRKSDPNTTTPLATIDARRWAPVLRLGFSQPDEQAGAEEGGRTGGGHQSGWQLRQKPAEHHRSEHFAAERRDHREEHQSRAKAQRQRCDRVDGFIADQLGDEDRPIRSDEHASKTHGEGRDECAREQRDVSAWTGDLRQGRNADARVVLRAIIVRVP